jgi:hypothetical protein
MTVQERAALARACLSLIHAVVPPETAYDDVANAIPAVGNDSMIGGCLRPDERRSNLRADRTVGPRQGKKRIAAKPLPSIRAVHGCHQQSRGRNGGLDAAA